MQPAEIDIAELNALRRDARRFQQFLDHPRDACHMLTLLMTGQGTKTHLGNILDQLHIQDIAKEGTRAAARIWQMGGADGKTGTELAAEKVREARAGVEAAQVSAKIAITGLLHSLPGPGADKLAAEGLAVIEANQQRRAQRNGHSYSGPERRKNQVIASSLPCDTTLSGAKA